MTTTTMWTMTIWGNPSPFSSPLPKGERIFLFDGFSQGSPAKANERVNRWALVHNSVGVEE
jgi:hypothetical protein